MTQLPFPLPILPSVLGTSAPQNAVTIRWLGTAGFEISAADTILLIDPYISRASFADCLLHPLESDLFEITRRTPRADAIFVGHTHFDHALDVPMIAKRTGAKVFGGTSAMNLCRGSLIAESKLINVERETGQAPYETDIGPFHIRFAPSAHSRFALGRVPFPGEIMDCDHVPMRTEKYRCGSVFRIEITVFGKTIVHLGSAELVERASPPNNIDLLLLCVAGWQSSERFPERVARALNPANVLLSHWDNFFKPLDQPAVMLPAMGVQKLCDRITSIATSSRVGAVPIFGEVTL
ncbi:MAG: MBL fold metallo-hydrolase [Polyangiaceae bacterium]|nr:MBL fold metallo-hydrolase [Polyangiaceae bacterium]